MNIDSKIAILCITSNGRSLACKIKSSLNDGDIYFINNKRDENLLDDNDVISKSLEEDVEIYTVKKRLKFLLLFILYASIFLSSIRHSPLAHHCPNLYLDPHQW